MPNSQNEKSSTAPSAVVPSTPKRRPLQSTTLPTNNPSLFSTPRRRKDASQNARAQPTTVDTQRRWPRLGQRVSTALLEDATSQIFGYKPRSWQVKLTEKVLEGNDAIGIAGTGSGKSLVFAMLAIAAELANFKGLVIVVSPLKSLQKDQVRK